MTSCIPKTLAVCELRSQDQFAITDLLVCLKNTYASAEAPEFVGDARRIAFCSLPRNLVCFVDRFRRTEWAPGIAIIGWRVDDARIGPTPRDWDAQRDPGSTRIEEFFFMLLGAILGDVFGWSSLQNGRFIHNVVPVIGQEQEQSGHGSDIELAWHTEDGFHDCRCDYLGLMGLRNDAHVPTTFGCIDAVALTAVQRSVLSQPRFQVRPDNEHIQQCIRKNPSASTATGRSLWSNWARPRPTAVLFGDPRRPYLRIDPYFMSALPGDRIAAQALADLVSKLAAALEALVIEPGTICFLDNYRAVHGRAAFRATYDGRDRWLKKLLISCNLRDSHALRVDPDKPVLMPAMLSEQILSEPGRRRRSQAARRGHAP